MFYLLHKYFANSKNQKSFGIGTFSFFPLNMVYRSFVKPQYYIKNNRRAFFKLHTTKST